MVDTSNSILQQIEESADYNTPDIYDLLTKYSRFSTTQDAAAFSFLPMSQAATSSRNPKLFIIGLLPPTANVTDRALDRSASIAAIKGMGVTGDANMDTRTAAEGSDGKPASNQGAGIPPVIPDANGRLNGPYVGTGAPLTDQFWVDYVAMCQRLKVAPEDLAVTLTGESGFNTSATAVRDGNVIAKGLNQLTRDTALGLRAPDGTPMSPEEYDNFGSLSAERQLYWTAQSLKGRGLAGLSTGQIYAKNFGDAYAASNPGNGVLYASSDFQANNGGSSAFTNAAFQNKAYAQNATLDFNHDGSITYADMDQAAANINVRPDYLAAIKKAQAGIAAGLKPTQGIAPLTADGSNPDWVKTGSKNASSASKGIARTADAQLNQTPFGQVLQKAQDAFRKATQAAIQQMANTPPLRMLVNPQSFRVSSEKIISDGNYGRNGPIVEHWGENQDKIEGSGKIGAFYALDLKNGNGPGLTRTARATSQSYQNLMSLYLLYKSNGTIWLSDHNDDQNVRDVTLSVLGSVYIYYDGILYLGSFESFTITEADSTPFSLDYTFSFVVRTSFVLDVDDADLKNLAQATGTILPVQGPGQVGPLDANGGGLVAPTISDAPAQQDLIGRAENIFTSGGS